MTTYSGPDEAFSAYPDGHSSRENPDAPPADDPYHPAGSCHACAEPPDFSLYEPCSCPCHGMTCSAVCGTCCSGEGPEDAAPGPRTVTGLPGSPPAVIEDDNAPHQVRVHHTAGLLTLTCTCIMRDRAAEPIAQGSRLPAGEGVARWRAWHAERGIGVAP